MEQRIGFGKRFGAWLLDVVICGILVATLGGTIGGLLGFGAAGFPTDVNDATAGAAMGAVVGMVAALGVIALVYFLVEGFTGYTLGKLLLGIRVANEDGSQASVPTLLTRYAIKNINYILSIAALVTGIQLLNTLGSVGGVVVFVGCFLVLGMSRQALHDRLAKTAVYPKAAVHAAA